MVAPAIEAFRLPSSSLSGVGTRRDVGPESPKVNHNSLALIEHRLIGSLLPIRITPESKQLARFGYVQQEEDVIPRICLTEENWKGLIAEAKQGSREAIEMMFRPVSLIEGKRDRHSIALARLDPDAGNKFIGDLACIDAHQQKILNEKGIVLRLHPSPLGEDGLVFPVWRVDLVEGGTHRPLPEPTAAYQAAILNDLVLSEHFPEQDLIVLGEVRKIYPGNHFRVIRARPEVLDQMGLGHLISPSQKVVTVFRA